MNDWVLVSQFNAKLLPFFLSVSTDSIWKQYLCSYHSKGITFREIFWTNRVNAKLFNFFILFFVTVSFYGQYVTECNIYVLTTLKASYYVTFRTNHINTKLFHFPVFVSVSLYGQCETECSYYLFLSLQRQHIL